jgi:predicted enzyme related to lactoylglutathione lyase
MGQPVVHFEIIGSDPARLRSYYGELFGWTFSVGDTVTETVSKPGSYGFVDATTNGDGTGPNGGVGGGEGFQPRVLFYVGVPDVEAALERPRASAEYAGWAPRELPEPSWSATSPT